MNSITKDIPTYPNCIVSNTTNLYQNWNKACCLINYVAFLEELLLRIKACLEGLSNAQLRYIYLHKTVFVLKNVAISKTRNSIMFCSTSSYGKMFKAIHINRRLRMFYSSIPGTLNNHTYTYLKDVYNIVESRYKIFIFTKILMLKSIKKTIQVLCIVTHLWRIVAKQSDFNFLIWN